MKCPACGYLSFDQLSACTNCGAPTVRDALPQAQLPLPGCAVDTKPGAPVRTRNGKKRRGARRAPVPARAAVLADLLAGADAADIVEVSDDDLDVQVAPPVPGSAGRSMPLPTLSLESLDVPASDTCPAAARPGPPALFRTSVAEAGSVETPAAGPPIIDLVGEIPARYWAPKGAGLVRRAAAALVDAALLAGLLTVFVGGAALALRREGIAVSALLSGSGLLAALTPLGLLAALLSFAYHVPCHAVSGQTPGQRLARLEVRSRDGSALTWANAAWRWCGGALGLACGGIGIAWALLEPRRRGWADLLSGTLIVERAREHPGRIR